MKLNPSKRDKAITGLGDKRMGEIMTQSEILFAS